jgi:hypothetical protein
LTDAPVVTLGLTLVNETVLEEATAEDVANAAAALEDASAAAPQLAGSMPSGQHTPSAKQKEPLGHDQDAEQHF